jgi:hypothetical protein
VRELELELVALGRELETPEPPDLAAAVRARIAAPRRRARPVRRVALAFALLALALTAATLAIPDARSALFRALHIGGARIELVDRLPEVPAGATLEPALGELVPLEEARRSAGFDLRELEEAPDRVYVGDRGTVWFLYGSPERPRLLVAQTPGHGVDEPLLLKKLAEAGTAVERVLVGDSSGVFLSGAPHFLFLIDAFGEPVEDSARLARDVLLWDAGGVAFRLEGDFTRAEALELADRLR